MTAPASSQIWIVASRSQSSDSRSMTLDNRSIAGDYPRQVRAAGASTGSLVARTRDSCKELACLENRDCAMGGVAEGMVDGNVRAGFFDGELHAGAVAGAD